MKYNFDKIIKRRGTDSIKWDGGDLVKKFGLTDHYDDETIPMFVADMDFETPLPVREALKKRVDQTMFGYTTHMANLKYFEAINYWFEKQQKWSISSETIVFSPGTVFALDIAVKSLTEKGEGIIIQRPVYPPFTRVIEGNGRRVVNNELMNREGFYVIDFDDLEEKASQVQNTMMILCSPHNPVGRIWQAEELQEMAEICERHGLILVSDEIHGDLIRADETFYPLANQTDYNRLVICTAINKTFNLAGLHCSNIVIPHTGMREKYQQAMGMQMPSPFAISALIAAYFEGEEWLVQLRNYLDDNFTFLIHFLKEKMPKVKIWKPQGTYIGWLDFSEYKLSPEEIHDRIYNKANVVLEDGKMFGKGSEYFQRICIPTPRSILEKALTRISGEF